MPDEYIRREDALFALRKAERGGSVTALTRLERAYAEIREMTAADVAEVVHGKWLDVYNDFTVAHCSNCGAAFDVADEGKGTATGWARFKNRYKGCPGCRALMDGAAE